jgi:TRAP-type C4-dicarboxylate transport system permease small subunit
LRRGLGLIAEWMNAAGATVIVIGMVLVCADVGARDFFNAPIPGVIELLKMSIVGIVFLQLPHCVLSGRMIRSDVFLDFLHQRAPAKAQALNTFHMVCGALFLAGVVWGVWPQLMDALRYNYFVGVPAGFNAPVWPVRTIIILGGALGLIAYVLNAVQGERKG